MVCLTFMDERYSLLIGLNYSSDCDRWSVVSEFRSDAEIRQEQQDKLTNSGIWSNAGEFQDDKVSREEIELYRQICIWRAAIFDPLNWMLDGLVDFPFSYTSIQEVEANGLG